MKKSRFEMLKKHNIEQLEEAIEEGKADEKMKKLCRFINSTENFFTSSSCAGRIALLSVKSIGEKQPNAFHRKWHRKVKMTELQEAIAEKIKEKELWFKLDPLILHVGARDLESARKVLKCMREAGLKRGGIILAQPEKFLIELQGTHSMALPVKSDGKVLFEKDYLDFILKQANKKLEENYKRLNLFEKVCRAELK